MSKSSVWTYRKIRKNLAEFIGEKYRLTDLAFGQLTEPFISDFRHYLLDEKSFSSGTITIYVSLFKKMCRIAFERGLCKNLLFAHYRVGTPKVTTPKALSMSDFIKIRDVELPEDEARDTLFPLLNTNRVRIDISSPSASCRKRARPIPTIRDDTRSPASLRWRLVCRWRPSVRCSVTRM